MKFSGPGAAQGAGNVLTTLTSRDGLPHARPGEPLCGGWIQRVAGSWADSYS